jgi:hypothetical protein
MLYIRALAHLKDQLVSSETLFAMPLARESTYGTVNETRIHDVNEDAPANCTKVFGTGTL